MTYNYESLAPSLVRYPIRFGINVSSPRLDHPRHFFLKVIERELAFTHLASVIRDDGRLGRYPGVVRGL